MRPGKSRTARKGAQGPIEWTRKHVYTAIGAVLGFVALVFAHTPWMIYQIRLPVYQATCEVGIKQDYVLHMIGSQNLLADQAAETLMAITIPSGVGSIPIHEMRVDFGNDLIDLGDHPSWERLITPVKMQDSAANMVVMHNVSYCNMPEPWTLWPKSSPVMRAKVYREMEYAETP